MSMLSQVYLQEVRDREKETLVKSEARVMKCPLRRDEGATSQGVWQNLGTEKGKKMEAACSPRRHTALQTSWF